jgi:hypothetical protein
MFMKSQILLITKPVAVKTAIVLGLSLSLINSNQLTLAQTTPPVVTPTQTSVVQTSSTSGDFFAPIENVIKEVDQFIGDVRGFVQNDLFGTLNELLSSSLGAIKIPDLSQISREILNAPTSRYEGTQLSDQLENKLGSSDSPGSTAIMSELDRQAQRNTATGIADGSTLSEEAQAQSRSVLQATEQDTTQNVQLAEQSQSLDVSQHILQNLSQQTALNAHVNARVLQEAQQARTDRAINNVLLSQAAQEISAINTSDRRGSITSGNQASSQAGMLMLPGGGYLGQTTHDSTN